LKEPEKLLSSSLSKDRHYLEILNELSHFIISEKLGFSGFEYQVGTYFKRSSDANAQVDLIFGAKIKSLRFVKLNTQRFL
jgi:hypothetical protein